MRKRSSPILLALFALSCGGSENAEAPSGDGGESSGGRAGAPSSGGQAGAAESGGGEGGQAGAAESGGGEGGVESGGTAGGGPASSGGEEAGGAGAEGGSPDPGAAGTGSGPCGLVETEHALEFPLHIAQCSSTSYDSNPPSSGHHYPIWAAFGVYDFALPRGFWVHNLEHGAIVVSHRCSEDCGSELEAAGQWLAGLEVDDFCEVSGARPRALLVHDPLLESEWAASAWGYTLTGSCFDAERFTQFYVDHVGNGPENVCGSGMIIRGLDELPEGCGQ